MTEFVKSKDGTSIAVTKIGSGLPVILVDGAFGYRNFGPNKALAELLKNDFTVVTYDRRGRGESANSLPYSVQREIEDLEAIIDYLAQPVFLYGISSGAALALGAANAGLKINKLALYEAPFIVDDTRKPLPENYLENLQSLTENDQRGKAVAYFMKAGVGLPAFVVWMIKLMPAWKKMKELAHTVIYDTLILGDAASGKPLQRDKWSNVNMKVLVISGSKSQQWMQNAMNQLANILPDADHDTLEGQNHIVNPRALYPVLTNFFDR